MSLSLTSSSFSSIIRIFYYPSSFRTSSLSHLFYFHFHKNVAACHSILFINYLSNLKHFLVNFTAIDANPTLIPIVIIFSVVIPKLSSIFMSETFVFWSNILIHKTILVSLVSYTNIKYSLILYLSYSCKFVIHTNNCFVTVK